MEINSLHGNQAFGRIVTGPTLKKKLLDPECKKSFICMYEGIKRRCYNQGISKTKNINIVLDYDAADGYFATIKPKKKNIEIVQNEISCFTNISMMENSIKKLQEWSEYWDNYYSNSGKYLYA